MFEARRRFRRHRTVQRLVAGVSGADEGEVTIRAWVDSTGVRVEDAAGRRDTPWSALTDVAADEHTILFVRDGLPVVYLPTDALASDDEARALVTYARERIAAARGPAGAWPAPTGQADQL